MRARVDTDVKGGNGKTQIVASEETEEGCIREKFAQPGTIRTVTDDDQANARSVLQDKQVIETLLGCESAEISDDSLPPGSQLPMELARAMTRVERLSIDPARPQAHAVDACETQLSGRGPRRREIDLSRGVNGPKSAPDGSRESRDAVPRDESGKIGLIRRDNRDVEIRGRANGRKTGQEGAGEVDDVHTVLTQESGHAIT
jgi:hypothetical protein